MAEHMRLELTFKEVEVTLVDNNGVEKNYTLKELSGRNRNQYLNKMSSRVKVDNRGKAMGIKNFDGFQSDLLKLSLFDESGEPVTVEDIEEMPSATQQALFIKAQSLSGLDNDQLDNEEKN